MKIEEAERLHAGLLPLLTYIMASPEHMLCYGKRMFAQRIGLGGGASAPSLRHAIGLRPGRHPALCGNACRRPGPDRQHPDGPCRASRSPPCSAVIGALIGAVGIGGVLLTPWLTHVIGLPVREAIVISSFAFIGTGRGGACRSRRRSAARRELGQLVADPCAPCPARSLGAWALAIIPRSTCTGAAGGIDHRRRDQGAAWPRERAMRIRQPRASRAGVYRSAR